MSRNFIAFGVLLACCLLEVPALPTNNEASTQQEDYLLNEFGERVIMTEKAVDRTKNNEEEKYTQNILDKIQVINENISRKPQKPQINFNEHTLKDGIFELDPETLRKIQQLIVSGKIHNFQEEDKIRDTNTLRNEVFPKQERSLPVLSKMQESQTVFPYLTSMPVLVVPSSIYGGYPPNNLADGMGNSFLTRQRPQLPFPIQWPLAQYFPVIVKDPLIGLLHGGGWDNFVEYGQNADVCSKKEKSVNDQPIMDELAQSTEENTIDNFDSMEEFVSRQGRALRKRTVPNETPLQQVEDFKNSKKIFSIKPIINTKKPIKQEYIEPQAEATKTDDSDPGDLRFPFGDFNWFGNRKPVAPSPGFFINRLKVRKGGVAIAGPGGVATAGRGGTALVGPGGLAYTQPGGLAIAGPHARVIALSENADLNSIVSRLQAQSSADGSIPRLLEAIPEGKVVATGPVVYYHHPNERT